MMMSIIKLLTILSLTSIYIVASHVQQQQQQSSTKQQRFQQDQSKFFYSFHFIFLVEKKNINHHIEMMIYKIGWSVFQFI